MQKSKEADSKQANVAYTLEITDLAVVDDAVHAPEKPDDYTKRFKNAKIRNYEQDITLRKHFSWATYGLLCIWLVIVAGLLVFSSRSDQVLITLISAATVQVIGLYYIVLRYIFPSRNEGFDSDV